MASAEVSACGLLFCYNEEAVIKETIKYYLSQGVDLVIFDNQSTDSSIDIINCFSRGKEQYSGRIPDLIYVATEGYDWETILREANDYMHKNLNHYEWILIIDADTHFFSPVRGLSLLEYIDTVKKYGYNIIHGRIYNFYPTKEDDYSITNYSERIKYFQSWNAYPQEKIFLYHPTINFYTRYAHWCLRDNRRVCINPGVISKHYTWLSYEQGVKKIFKDRKPRYIRNFPIQPQYVYMLPLEKCFIKDSRELKYYDEKQELISRWQFLWITRLIFIYNFIFKGPEKISTAANPSFNASATFNRQTIGLSKKILKFLRKMAKTIIPAPYRAFIKLLRPYAISPTGYNYAFSNIIDRLIPPNLSSESLFPDLAYPSEYHFLMTSYCHARCVFCNQLDNKPKNEITLDKFKVMVSHIAIDSVDKFYFSGGGEPLLCRDLFDIIQYVNSCFPQIKISLVTNGLLIEKYAENIARLDIDRLIISVHATEEMNNCILQIKNSESIFKGLALLNKYQGQFNKKIYKVFSVTVSRINVNEIPGLIKKAAELKVNEVSILYCRYYHHRIGQNLKTEDSLFFHKEMYNSMIKKSAKLAKKLGVSFSHEPLFLEKFKEQRCCAPWYLLLVDWDGDVYPCTAGEVCFYQKVKSGAYHFGNLCKEDVSAFWFSELYTKLRRHILACSAEKYIPECDTCHNILCFQGPDLKEGHIISSPTAV